MKIAAMIAAIPAPKARYRRIGTLIGSPDTLASAESIAADNTNSRIGINNNMTIIG